MPTLRTAGCRLRGQQREMVVVGLMSGTSADGIDAVVVELPPAGTRGAGRLLAHTHYPYPAGLDRRVLRAGEGGTATAEIGHLHAYLGELFAQAALGAIAAAGLTPEAVDAIGSHGQTVHHAPEPRLEPSLQGAAWPGTAAGQGGGAAAAGSRPAGGAGASGVQAAGDPVAVYGPDTGAGAGLGAIEVRSTLQLGQPAVIAERTGVTTVADFRPRDLAAGGQGAPLAPYAHALLFGDPSAAVAVQNLGGIGNVTFIPAGGGPADVLAFDTGPANMVIDGLVGLLTVGRERYDRDGVRAARGRVDRRLLDELLADPYFARRPPKSTGREHFGATYVASLRRRGAALGLGDDDLVATATALTAESIARAYRDFLPAPPARVVLCGGGARNPTLAAMLRDALASHLAGRPGGGAVRVELSDAAGLPAEAVEAVCFAVLARETLAGLPAGLPQVTGAARPTLLGVIAPGRGFPGLTRLTARPRAGSRGPTGEVSTGPAAGQRRQLPPRRPHHRSSHRP